MRKSVPLLDSETTMHAHTIGCLDKKLATQTMEQLKISRRVAAKLVEREVDAAIKQAVIDL